MAETYRFPGFLLFILLLILFLLLHSTFNAPVAALSPSPPTPFTAPLITYLIASLTSPFTAFCYCTAFFTVFLLLCWLLHFLLIWLLLANLNKISAFFSGTRLVGRCIWVLKSESKALIIPIMLQVFFKQIKTETMDGLDLLYCIVYIDN